MLVPREHSKCVVKVMQEFGVVFWRFESAKKHPILRFEINGVKLKYKMVSSPSDSRSLANCRADLRRMCRLHLSSNKDSIQK